MKSIQRRFNKIWQLNPAWSSYIAFAEAVGNQKFSRRSIIYHFNNLVDRDDYSKTEKRQIIKHLFSISAGI